MDTLLSAAHCRREFGEVLFNALVSSDNTEEVREFAKTLRVRITVGGCVYELLPLRKRVGLAMIVAETASVLDWAKDIEINTGVEDCERFLSCQREIPQELGDIVINFTICPDPSGDKRQFASIRMDTHGKWFLWWRRNDTAFSGDRFARRIK